ncbi:alpha/beta fold hydrolase [Actinomadura rubrisoli]|uniref:Alpha/beta hydrolase n=1 Tax=Actinomadura rubrisoli TaxID=2530368 RepID=A0A4R5CCB8_9ACTN|nr:alpha/beta hydrolase [Actinomadura rubrisoli]TDD96436.1 alpha/beta hydrolase [Actinomadura rubrisoli]
MTSNNHSNATAAVHHRTATVRGLKVAYREAGARTAPTIVLLHGFPTASHMFSGLIEDLAGTYHVLAPDYIGFGASDAPAPDRFKYTFENLATVTSELLDQLGAERFALYIQDYGAPIGLRIAERRPGLVSALIVQNGNAYLEGITPFWDALRPYWKDRETHLPAVRELLSSDDFHWTYTHGVPAERLDRVNPDNRALDRLRMDRPGNVDAQAQLFWDYQNNLDFYPAFHAYFRSHRPPTLIAWGRHDEIFGADGARAFLRDLPDAELHLLDASHFALETHREEIAALIHDFLPRALHRPGRD